MAQAYLYEPQYRHAGWFDGSGPTLASWFDHDITEGGGEIGDGVIQFMLLEASFWDDDDLIFQPPPITVEVLPELFLDPDLFFTPTNARALSTPTDQMLKNEVRRIR